jgi:nucleoside-diphosphate-sugar epimerase
MREIARILADHAGPLGFRVPTRRLPSFLLRLVARWDKAVRLIVPELGLRQDCSDAKARELLGWTPRSAERMVIDMADSMIGLGVVTPQRRLRRHALTNVTPGARA